MVNPNEISEQMDVICSCGTRIGEVDRVEFNEVKLAKNDPIAGGRHHYIPLEWVDFADDYVVLNKDYEEVRHEWTLQPALA